MLALMRIGLIGAGNMAAALARGFAEPVLVSDPDASRAQALAAEVGGEALPSNAEVAERADLIVLCHKPAQLEEVAGEIASHSRALASILWGVPVEALEDAYPDAAVYRFMPNIPVEVGRGVLGYVPGRLAASGPERDVLDLFERLGTVIALDEAVVDVAGALYSCGPAFFALVAEALVEATTRRGLDQTAARRMAVETMAGTAAVLSERGDDTLALRRRVASPGGVTEKGLDALERGGVRDAFDDAIGIVVGQGAP